MPRWLSRSPGPPERAQGRSGPALASAETAGGAPLPPEAGPELLALARSAIEHAVGAAARRDRGRVGGEHEPDSSIDADGDSWLDAPGACFVTLTNAGRLRGCIGTIEPRRSLRADVTANAVAAATRDGRFAAVTAAEVADVSVEVSVLSASAPMTFTDETDALAQLRPGVDGIVLECRGRRATYLPQVWDKLPDPAGFLGSLKVKAGVPRDFWSDDIELSRYGVTEFHEPARTAGE